MAGLPQNFAALSNVLPTYEFIDILSGTGYITFYLGTTVDAKRVSDFTFYSENVYLEVTHPAASADYELAFDYDFDVVLNRPLDIRGVGIVNIGLCINSGGAYNTYMYVTVKLRKWDGSAETEIASNDSSVASSAADATYYYKCVDLDIALTHFKKGETLRVTLLGYVDCDQAARSSIVQVGVDPKNRTTGWDASGVVPS